MIKRKHASSRRSPVSRQIMSQYLLTLTGYVAAIAVAYIIAQQICNFFVWQPYDPLYVFLKLLQTTSIYWMGLLILGGSIFITYRTIARPLGYLDEIVSAAKALSASPDKPIALSAPLLDAQNELNLAREVALRNAMHAKEAEQRKNDLIVYLAHDLKTPLTSVIGYLTLLRDEPDVPAAQRAKYTGIALDKAERLETLINEFFDITRFNLSHLTLEIETINLTRMLEQIGSEFAPALAVKDLRLAARLQPDVQLASDPDKLERVFDNLLRNAVSYSYPGTEIHLLLAHDGENVTVMVRNRGRTIPPEKLQRIFDQFFRLDSSRASASGGAGLGLAIAKEIVELHGGTIGAESADENVELTVTLPLGRQKIV